MVAISTRRNCARIRSRIFPPSSASTNRCRFQRAPGHSRGRPREIRERPGSRLVGISLFYREGYFQQPLTRTTGRRNLQSARSAEHPGRAGAGRERPADCVQRGNRHEPRGVSGVARQRRRVPVYLLDTNRPKTNSISAILRCACMAATHDAHHAANFIGNRWHSPVRTLGVQPSTFHMNEGHAAFLTLGIDPRKKWQWKSFSDAIITTKAECHFTTHTPVEAGHDRFTPR